MRYTDEQLSQAIKIVNTTIQRGSTNTDQLFEHKDLKELIVSQTAAAAIAMATGAPIVALITSAIGGSIEFGIMLGLAIADLNHCADGDCSCLEHQTLRCPVCGFDGDQK